MTKRGVTATKELMELAIDLGSNFTPDLRKIASALNESWAIKNVVPVDHTDEQLMVLPLAHIFARHLIWGAVEQGVITVLMISVTAI